MTDKLSKKDIINLLPHREPMLLIDELINIKKIASCNLFTSVGPARINYYSDEKTVLIFSSIPRPVGHNQVEKKWWKSYGTSHSLCFLTEIQGHSGSGWFLEPQTLRCLRGFPSHMKGLMYIQRKLPKGYPQLTP